MVYRLFYLNNKKDLAAVRVKMTERRKGIIQR